jgi:hypothetical protein
VQEHRLTSHPPQKVYSAQEFIEWETALTDYFLATKSGDATPIRSFEVTPATLANAISAATLLDSYGAVDRFRHIFSDHQRTFDALERGRYDNLDNIGLPGCFSFLALTLFVDSLIDEQFNETGQFRPKLADFLRVDRSFSNLCGVAEMWNALDSWLRRQHQLGRPFRLLNLPDPGAWTHIGHTVRLSFPSRRDKRLVLSFLDEHEGVLDSPRTFLNAFRNIANSNRASWALREAFADFHHAFLAGKRALGEHRFWLMVLALAEGREKAPTPLNTWIEMTRDQDGVWTFVVATSSLETIRREVYALLDVAAAEVKGSGRGGIGRDIGKGFLLFRQAGHARWNSASSLSECIGRVMIAVSSQARLQIGNRLAPLVESGSWLLTREPVTVDAAKIALCRLGLCADNGDEIINVVVRDGVRNGGVWLGRPTFLPCIQADRSVGPQSGYLQVRAEDEVAGSVSCTELHSSPGLYRLESDRPLNGRYIISPADERSGSPTWSRRLSFTADALSRDPEGESVAGLPLQEWDDVVDQAFGTNFAEATWDEVPTRLDDLNEAIYAAGRTGWDEAEMVTLISQAYGRDLNPWDVIRSFQESSILRPTLRPMWRGRVWRLGSPKLIRLDSINGDVLVAGGCISATMADEFKRASEGAGARCFRRRGVSEFAPMLLGCVGGNIEVVAERLQWKLQRPKGPGSRRLAFHTTTRSVERHRPATSWDWRKRRFVPHDEASAEVVSLTRWTHPGGADHDIYVIRRDRKEWKLLSRPAAICLAHCLAAIPLFRFSGGRLLRLASEGSLPDAVAAAARLHSLINPGPAGKEFGYAYPVTRVDGLKIAKLLPELIEGIKVSSNASGLEAAALVRHSGGRIRAIWLQGRLSTADRC